MVVFVILTIRGVRLNGTRVETHRDGTADTSADESADAPVIADPKEKQ